MSEQASNFDFGPSRGISLGNQVHVLMCLRADPEMRVRDLAARIGITECSVQRIIGELEAAGLLRRIRKGRRNHYRLHLDAPLDPRLESGSNVRELIDWLDRGNPNEELKENPHE